MSILTPHQQRVVVEEMELSEKLGKLLAFFETDGFKKVDEAEQKRMKDQSVFMEDYRDVLRERMAAFGATPGIKTASGEPFTPTA